MGGLIFAGAKEKLFFYLKLFPDPYSIAPMFLGTPPFNHVKDLRAPLSYIIPKWVSEKRTNFYLPSLDLVPGGKSTVVRNVEVKLQALEEIKGTLFSHAGQCQYRISCLT